MNTKEFIGQRISYLRTKKLKISGNELGRLLEPNISGKTISSWETGRTSPDHASLIQLSAIFDVPITEFYPLDPLAEYGFSSEVAYVNTPLFGSIAAGKPLAVIPVEDTHPIPLEMHQKYPNAFLLRVEGESMNKVLPNKSFALIDPDQIDPANEAVYAFCINDQDATIKRVRKLPDGFEMIPDSHDSSFKPISYSSQQETPDNITIIGRVVWMMLPFDWVL
ncbi:MAG: LexA family protein [Raoultibacter sp.]|jgi:repressor LexA